MSFDSGVLVGICRSMPEIQNFVIPVFQTNGGTRVFHRLSQGRIVGFDEADLRKDFVPLTSTMRVAIGDVAVYGLEFEDCICVGPAMSAAVFVRNLVKPDRVIVFRPKSPELFEEDASFRPCGHPSSSSHTG